ncbi:suppressor of loss of ypt1 [Lunasporangiospora selenospora]|uniref:Suppressor of loss of ypt1 n=1 Tax=Lunasporangiospora selenospora TaxID=979761 RepID=A0A9P6G3I0_9FUNG|nr:suppressor of loss of ypt1 [Lunasporangiospora selenospora]
MAAAVTTASLEALGQQQLDRPQSSKSNPSLSASPLTTSTPSRPQSQRLAQGSSQAFTGGQPLQGGLSSAAAMADTENTADVLFHAIAAQNQNTSHPNHTATHGNNNSTSIGGSRHTTVPAGGLGMATASVSSSEQLQQLPTPRTSTSSGAASPPEAHSPPNATVSQALLYPHQNTPSNLNRGGSRSQLSLIHQSHPSTAPPSSSSLTPSVQSTTHHTSQGQGYYGHQHSTFATTTTTTTSTTTQQNGNHAGVLSRAGSRSSQQLLQGRQQLQSHQTHQKSLSNLRASSPHLPDTVSSAAGMLDIGGSTIGGLGGMATSTGSLASPNTNILSGRPYIHQHGLHQQSHSDYEQQYQDQLLQQQLEDEKELQKRKTRTAVNSVSSFLPPKLNMGLNKVVQSAKEAVSPITPQSKMALPTTATSTTATNRVFTGMGVGMNDPNTTTHVNLGLGISGTSHLAAGITPTTPTFASAFAPRTGSAASIRHVLLRLYRAAKLPLICLLWYLSSAVTNNLGKQLLNQFQYPVTLTFVQFWFVSLFCFMGGAVLRVTSRIRKPTRRIIEMTAPLVGFQVIGHVFSSIAISRVPLSVVHTIKALTPLFTVLFYRVVLGTTYGGDVYLSLVPLTAGVMLACRMKLEFDNVVGLSCALTSTLVFVAQNVFTKKILSSSGGGNAGAAAKPKQELPTDRYHGHDGAKESSHSNSAQPLDPVEQLSGSSQKLDKMNILFYSSTMAAVCMIPMWFYAEGWTLMTSSTSFTASGIDSDYDNSDSLTITWLLLLNGVSHFFQNVFAFSVLALTSPVTYSIASLIKRIVVIVASIVYFHQALGLLQWTGVCMTFWGLWMYNSAKNAAKVNPASSLLATTRVGRRMSRGFSSG